MNTSAPHDPAHAQYVDPEGRCLWCGRLYLERENAQLRAQSAVDIGVMGEISKAREEAFRRLDAANLQNGELREALKRVDEILVPLLHEQDQRDRHQFLAEFSQVHDPRGIIRKALEGTIEKPKCEHQCKHLLIDGKMVCGVCGETTIEKRP